MAMEPQAGFPIRQASIQQHRRGCATQKGQVVQMRGAALALVVLQRPQKMLDIAGKWWGFYGDLVGI